MFTSVGLNKVKTNYFCSEGILCWPFPRGVKTDKQIKQKNKPYFLGKSISSVNYYLSAKV